MKRMAQQRIIWNHEMQCILHVLNNINKIIKKKQKTVPYIILDQIQSSIPSKVAIFFNLPWVDATLYKMCIKLESTVKYWTRSPLKSFFTWNYNTFWMIPLGVLTQDSAMQMNCTLFVSWFLTTWFWFCIN